MKKRLFLGLAALVAVTFTGCQKDQVINQTSENTPIEFGTYVGRGAQTKVNTSIDGLGDLAGKNFGVFAYYTEQVQYNPNNSPMNFMYNQKVIGVQSGTTYSWTYSPVKYWPNNPNDKVSFFAYAPYDTHLTSSHPAILLPVNNSEGDPKVTYVVQDDCEQHVDLMYSKSNNTNVTKQTVEGNVKFDFAHALSRIGFSAQILNDIVAKDPTGSNNSNVSENNQINTGETTVAIEEIELIGKFAKKGDLNLNGGIWGAISEIEENFIIKSSNLYKCITSESNTLKEKTLLNTSDGSDDKGYLMVIPQSFDGSDDAKALKIRVKYTVTTKDANLNGGESKITNNIISDPFAINFEQGKAYNFHLQLGLTSVKFTADVAQWEEGRDMAVNVPINTK